MNFVDRVPLYYDLMALALETDSTRVITLGLADIGANYGGFKISRGYHQLTHHGKVPEYITELSVIEQFHMEQLARFLNRLKSVRDNHGNTLLDSTMVLFGRNGKCKFTSTRIFHWFWQEAASNMVSTSRTSLVKAMFYSSRSFVCFDAATLWCGNRSLWHGQWNAARSGAADMRKRATHRTGTTSQGQTSPKTKQA